MNICNSINCIHASVCKKEGIEQIMLCKDYQKKTDMTGKEAWELAAKIICGMQFEDVVKAFMPLTVPLDLDEHGKRIVYRDLFEHYIPQTAKETLDAYECVSKKVKT